MMPLFEKRVTEQPLQWMLPTRRCRQLQSLQVLASISQVAQLVDTLSVD